MSSLFRSQSSSFAWPSIHDDGTSLGQLRFRVLEFRVSVGMGVLRSFGYGGC